MQNYPDPFNPSTTIQYAFPTRSRVRLAVYNILGQVIADLVDKEQAEGYQSVVWHANVASGLYFYRIEPVSVSDPAERFVNVKKMILLNKAQHKVRTPGHGPSWAFLCAVFYPEHIASNGKSRIDCHFGGVHLLSRPDDDSLQGYKKVVILIENHIRNVAQPGSALAWGARGRGFKSRRSD